MTLKIALPTFFSGKTPSGCAVIVGLEQDSPVVSALCAHAVEAGLVTYRVIHDPAVKRGTHPAHSFQINAPSIHAIRVDISSTDAVQGLFADIAKAGFIPEWVVHAPARSEAQDTLVTTPMELEAIWRAHSLSAFLIGQTALKAMLAGRSKHRSGRAASIIFIGAVDAVQSQPRFTGFGAVKAGVRALVQSMAREFDPQGIHIAHLLLDDAGFSGQVTERFAQAVATTCWQIHTQPSTAWTQELELRSNLAG